MSTNWNPRSRLYWCRPVWVRWQPSRSHRHLSALALAGRLAEALDHYAGLRERLVAEFGAEPGNELSERHTALLRRAHRWPTISALSPAWAQTGRAIGP